MLKLIEGILFVLIVLSFYAMAEANDTKELWVKCVYYEKIVPCKLLDGSVFINGKLMKVHKIDVISSQGVTYVLLKDKDK